MKKKNLNPFYHSKKLIFDLLYKINNVLLFNGITVILSLSLNLLELIINFCQFFLFSIDSNHELKSIELIILFT